MGGLGCALWDVSTHQMPGVEARPAVTTRHISRCHPCASAVRPAACHETGTSPSILPREPSLLVAPPPRASSLTSALLFPLPENGSPLPSRLWHLTGVPFLLGSCPSSRAGPLPYPTLHPVCVSFRSTVSRQAGEAPGGSVGGLGRVCSNSPTCASWKGSTSPLPCGEGINRTRFR